MAEIAVVPSWVVRGILEVAEDFPFTKAFLTRLKNRAASLGVDVVFDFNRFDHSSNSVGKRFVFRCQEISSGGLSKINPEHEKAANDLQEIVSQHVRRNWRRCPSYVEREKIQAEVERRQKEASALNPPL